MKHVSRLAVESAVFGAPVLRIVRFNVTVQKRVSDGIMRTMAQIPVLLGGFS
jgi:hypothetical protein